MTRSTFASVTVTAEAGASLTCSVNAGPWFGCSSPVQLSGLSDGQQTLEVRATDGAGNVGPIATTSWIVDTTPPSPPVLSGVPALFTISRDAIIGFLAEADASFTCSFDGAGFAPCGSSPKALTGLADGQHVLLVKATDLAGNSSLVSTASWTVDTAAPEPPVLGGQPDPSKPGVLVNSREAAITFSGEPGAAFTCSIDDGAYEPCGQSPKTLAGLPDGDHSLSVVATDASGKSSAPAVATWTVDATAPEKPVLTGVPPALTKTTSATIGFSSESGVDFSCSVDGGEFTDCGSSPLVLNDLADGQHSVVVRATDSAGNHSEARADWEVGLLPPARPALDEHPGALVTKASVRLAWVSDPRTSSACSLDGGRFRTCRGPLRLPKLKNGRHTFIVRDRDAFGMVSPDLTVRWVTDTAIPRAPRIGRTSGVWIRTQSARYSIAPRGRGQLQCRIDSGRWRNCSKRLRFSPRRLKGVEHRLTVRQVSAVGNPGPSTSTRFSVSDPVTVRYKSLSSGTFFVALRKPKTCKKGQLRFSMWGEGIKTLRYKGTARCGFNSRVYRMGSGISGALNDYSDGSDRYSDVTFTIGGRERYTVVRRVKWRLSFAGRSLGQGRVLFKRTYRAGRPNTRVYWDEDPDRYWRYDVCLRYGNDPARNMMAYCVWPGTPSRWSSHVGRW